MIWLLAQAADDPAGGIASGAAVGTVTGMLVAFGWLFFRGMSHADARVDEAFNKTIAAAETERERLAAQVKEGQDRWREAETQLRNCQQLLAMGRASPPAN